MATWYVQHADFSADEMGKIDCGQAVGMFQSDTPGRPDQGAARPADPLPRCIGFNTDAETFLEIACGSNGYLVRVSCRKPTKLLGLIPRNGIAEQIMDDVPREDLPGIIEAFFTGGPDETMELLRRRK